MLTAAAQVVLLLCTIITMLSVVLCLLGKISQRVLHRVAVTGTVLSFLAACVTGDAFTIMALAVATVAWMMSILLQRKIAEARLECQRLARIHYDHTTEE